MRSWYNFLFAIGFIFSSPYYFFKMWRRGNWKTGFKQRFGKYNNKVKQSVTNRHVIWMHAVSVGEMNVCLQVIRALQPRMPNLKIMVSTTTTTGMGELQKRMPAQVGKIYYPIDFRKCVTRALSSIHPNAVVLVESEIWPNFIWRLRSLGRPIFLVNARLSDRSYPRYKWFGFIFRELFGAFTVVGAQNETDAARFRELGCKSEAVHVVGNLKFDAAGNAGREPLDVLALLAQLGVPADAQLLVAGSTHRGEEKILGQQFLRLRKRFPKLFLVIVPRHAERAHHAADDLDECGIKFELRSEVKPETKLAPGSVDCLLVNTTGELHFFYERASVVFVGKSISAKGGQNPIEPAALGKAVIVGPNMQNFTDVVRILLKGDGLVQIRNAAELEPAFADLLSKPERREQLGQNAKKVVEENQGAVKRTVDLIVENLRYLGTYMPFDDDKPDTGT